MKVLQKLQTGSMPQERQSCLSRGHFQIISEKLRCCYSPDVLLLLSCQNEQMTLYSHVACLHTCIFTALIFSKNKQAFRD